MHKFLYTSGGNRLSKRRRIAKQKKGFARLLLERILKRGDAAPERPEK